MPAPSRTGRPRRDPAAARINVRYRVHPATAQRIADEARRTGEGAGQVIDRLAAELPANGDAERVSGT